MDDSIEVSQDGAVATFVVAGELELVQGDKLEALARRLVGEVERVVIDLSGVTFMDSSGLGALIAVNQAANEAGAKVVLRDPPQAVTKVLDLTATASVFDIEATHDDVGMSS